MAAHEFTREQVQRLGIAWSARRRQACFSLNVKGAIGVDPNRMATDEALIIAKKGALTFDHEVANGEWDMRLGEGHPSPGLGQEPGHGTAVIEDDCVPDGDRDEEDMLEFLGREVVRRMREKRLCNSMRASEILRVGSWSESGRLGLDGGCLRWLMDSSRAVPPVTAVSRGSRAQAQRPRRGTPRACRLCTNVHNALQAESKV